MAMFLVWLDGCGWWWTDLDDKLIKGVPGAFLPSSAAFSDYVGDTDVLRVYTKKTSKVVDDVLLKEVLNINSHAKLENHNWLGLDVNNSWSFDNHIEMA